MEEGQAWGSIIALQDDRAELRPVLSCPSLIRDVSRSVDEAYHQRPHCGDEALGCDGFAMRLYAQLETPRYNGWRRERSINFMCEVIPNFSYQCQVMQLVVVDEAE